MNEPAFPGVTYITLNGQKNPEGMTLRDYFAARAMQGFLAYATHKGIYAPPDNELASAAFQLADAMMEARNVAQ